MLLEQMVDEIASRIVEQRRTAIETGMGARAAALIGPNESVRHFPR
jgi:hypothetical protein